MSGSLIKLTKLIASGNTGSVMMDSHCMSLGLRRLSGLASKPATTKIGVVIRSFDSPLVEKNFLGLPPNTGKIGLPDSRVLYTVLRSPHIDKKSREQFEMRIKKRYLVIEAARHELHKKFFWLKRQRIFGAQYEIKFTCNTRLDKGKLQKLLSGSTSLGEGSGIAAKALGISLEDARVEVEKINGRGSEIVDAEISFTPRAKRLLELSLEESRQLDPTDIRKQVINTTRETAETVGADDKGEE